MASSPLYRATPELPRHRSSYSVPVQPGDINRGGTPGSSRGSKSFFNRSVNPSSSRSQSVARDDPASLASHMQRVASAGKVLESWSEVERKYKDAWLEDDDEIDLATETVHKSDGSTAPWQPDRGQSIPDWAMDEDDSIQAGPSRRRTTSRRPEDADDDTDSNEDSHDDVQDMDAGGSEGDDDELGSWQDQEDELKVQLAHRKAALLLASLKNRPEQTSDEEMAEFLRDEETARARRMSARAEGRDSRCHTDALSESVKSDSETSEEEYRSPSRFSTIITDTVEELFSDDESGEDELALPSSDVEVGDDRQNSEESIPEVSVFEPGQDPPDIQKTLQQNSEMILARAREVRSDWPVAEPSRRRLTIDLSPDSSPESDFFAQNTVPTASTSFVRRHLKPPQPKIPRPQPDLTRNPPSADQIPTTTTAREIQNGTIPKTMKGRADKGKSRMRGERPTELVAVDDVFGSAETIKSLGLDRRRYRRSRYRQKTSEKYKTCRHCRNADPARAKFAEYCRGANHSKLCTFEYPSEDVTLSKDVESRAAPVPPPTSNKYWKTPRSAVVPTRPTAESGTPSTTRLSGHTSNGLEKWRYFGTLIKKPDKETNRSCPYCRVSDDPARLENAVYCRGRIESRDCTFEGHKGSLRVSTKSRRVKAKSPLPQARSPVEIATPKTPLHPIGDPDLTIDETTLDLKLYYASLIRDQLQSGYRYCSDCARSDDQDRRRLCFWCRGRISYKACGYWDGDESSHRKGRQRSVTGSKSASKAEAAQPPQIDTPEGPLKVISTHDAKDQVISESNNAIPSRKRGRPRKSDVVPKSSNPEVPPIIAQITPTHAPISAVTGTEKRPYTEPVQRKRGRPRKSAPGVDPIQDATSYPLPKRPITPSTVSKPRARDMISLGNSRPTSEISESTSKSRPGRQVRDSGSPPRSVARRKRSRTFDIVVPASRSSPAVSSPTPEAGLDGDLYLDHVVAPVSDMRSTHISGHGPPHRLDLEAGIRELESLPPSSPPASLSPSASPEPIRFMPSGHRSSPLASVHQQDRSSPMSRTGFTPIRGILRQSSEASDAPRKRSRVSFSLVRSPSPANGSQENDYDSDSSDDVLLLVDPSSSSRPSAPASTQRHGTSSPFASEPRFVGSPQVGRLSSSTLAAYARPLERSPLSHLGHALSFHTPPLAARSYTGQRSPLSIAPTTSRSVPPSSSRGLMLPPPIPNYRLAPIPRTEPPRSKEADRRARSAGLGSRPRSLSMSSRPGVRQPASKLVAENIVIRRLINDVS